MALVTTILTPLLLRLVYPARAQDRMEKLEIIPPELIEAVEEAVEEAMQKEHVVYAKEESHVR